MSKVTRLPSIFLIREVKNEYNLALHDYALILQTKTLIKTWKKKVLLDVGHIHLRASIFFKKCSFIFVLEN